MLEFIQEILNIGAAVMLPVVMTILGIVLGMGFAKPIRAGLIIGIGFTGLNLAVGLLMTTIAPAIGYYESLNSSRFTTVDMGWAAMGAAVWSVPFAALAILLIVVVNVVLILLRWTKVLNVDIWNYIHFLIPGTLVYALTGSAVLGLIATVGFSVVSLFVGQRLAPKWQSTFNLPGTTVTTFSFITFAYPLGWALNALFDKIPKVRDIDLSMEKVSKRLGLFGDTAFIGLFVGVLLGVLTRQSWQGVLTMGVGIAAVLVLLPRMVSIMMEGLSAIGTGAQVFMKKRLKRDSELYIGMDIALSLGGSGVVAVGVLLIPLSILFAFIIPGMSYFPIGLLTVAPYLVPMFALASGGNLFRTLISSAIFLFIVEFLANVFAPEATAMMSATGVAVSGQVTDAFFGFNPANVIISAIHALFGR